MNNKQRKTYKALHADPVRADIAWSDVVSLFQGLGAELSQGRGSRVRVVLNGVRAVFHEPHPEREICKDAVRSVRQFLDAAGIDPDAE